MRITPSAIATACLLLAGCGGGGGSGGAGGTPPPTGLLTAPANLASGLSGTLALAAAAPPNASVAAVDFEIDGNAVGSDGSAPFTASVDSSAYADGQHIVRARSRDGAGAASPWSSATVSFSNGRAVPAGFSRDETFVTGLGAATAFVQAGDGRLFIAEQGGALRVVKNGALLPAPFVQLAGVDAQGERGLIGVTLDPAFASNGFVYVHYTSTAGVPHNRISRLTANGDVALPGSELPLIDLPPLSSATNHNGGAIHFGSDGKLYVGVGENADAPRSQDLSNPFGKLLRFDSDGGIPNDNPFFATQSGLARAIWAYGLRNPFTFAVQPQSGRIHINDVGAGSWEEIDVGVVGANYGWPNSEGPDGSGAGITAPLFAYAHADARPPGAGPGGFFVGSSIAGGAFYPATGPFPAEYRGDYFFADFVTRFVGRIDLDNGNAAYAFGSVSDNPVDMLVANDGSLLVLTRSGVTRFSTP